MSKVNREMERLNAIGAAERHPPHINATMATMASIFRELGEREQKRQKVTSK